MYIWYRTTKNITDIFVIIKKKLLKIENFVWLKEKKGKENRTETRTNQK